MNGRRQRDERGQTTMLIIGFASILVVAIAVVIDASAAFLQRQGLDTLADGAALYGADLGSMGVYADGLPEARLEQQQVAARQAVHDYLSRAGAYQKYPGLRPSVQIDTAADRITVALRAPMELPLSVPGVASTTMIGARGTAAVAVDR